MSENENTGYTPDQDALAAQISAIFRPANNAMDAGELISNLDLLETLRERDPDLGKKHVYDAMQEQGFKPLNIDGIVYWPVLLV
jgi:hypothetical protein